LSGIFLGILTFGAIAFLAAIGYTPAFGFMVVLLAGFAMLAIGARMRGPR
jgi:hypothetical protein